MSEDRDCLVCGQVCDEVIPVSFTNKTVYVKVLKDHVVYDYRRICLECLQKVTVEGKRKYTK